MLNIFKRKKDKKVKYNTFFVAPDGNDQNYGNSEAPFATIDAALSVARMSVDPSIIYIRRGRYFITSAIELSENDNGTVIEAYEGEEVILDGGAVLENSDFKPISEKTKSRLRNPSVADRILEINLRPYRLHKGTYGTRGFRRAYVNAPNELFIDGKPYSVSAYPKLDEPQLPLTSDMIIDGGSVPYTGDFTLKPAKIKIDGNLAKAWKNASSAYISGYFAHSYADDTIKIKSIDTSESTLTTELPHLFGFVGNEGNSYRIVNLLEEISRPGEYFIDIDTDTLYVYPEKDISMSLIQISSLDRPIISAKNASDVIIKGLIFENSRNSGIYIEGGQNVKIEKCIFRNLGILGIQIGKGATPMPEGKHSAHGVRDTDVAVPTNLSGNMGNWHEYLYEFAAWNNDAGTNHTVSDCTVIDTGAGGILLSGGDRKSLQSGNNTVYNCYFARNNRLNRTYAGAVNVMGVGNKIQHCEFEDLPGVAIYIHGNNHDISYNRIHNVIREVSDMGTIYMGRDCTEVGNKIHHNFIYDISTSYKTGWGICAVYIDDNAIYNSVYSNFFYNIITEGRVNFDVIYFNRGGMTSVRNNFFIDCNCNCTPKLPDNGYENMHTNPLFIKRAKADVADFSGVNVTSAVWKRAYPYLYKTYKRNYNAGILFYNNHYINGNSYNIFEDVKAKNFKITEKYAAFLKNKKSDAYITDPVAGIKNERVPYEIPDFENIGRITDENR